jgi:hypothetical protein
MANIELKEQELRSLDEKEAPDAKQQHQMPETSTPDVRHSPGNQM